MTQPNLDRGTDTSAVRRRYDRAARCYDCAVWPMEILAMARFREKLLPLVRGPRVLEVGVGTGRNLTGYPRNLTIDAIDLSSGMLRRARRRRYRADVSLFEMDVQDLAFPTATFDTVVSTCVFCSVPDPIRGLAEVRRVLRPDGQALLLEHVRPGGRWLGALFDWLDPVASRLGPHINRRTVDNVRAAGLSVAHETNLFSDIVKLIVARRCDEAEHVSVFVDHEGAAGETSASADALCQAGEARLQEQAFAAAAETLERCIAVDPTRAYAYYYAGMVYRQIDRVDRMADRFETFVRLAPDAPERPRVEAILEALRR